MLRDDLGEFQHLLPMLGQLLRHQVLELLETRTFGLRLVQEPRQGARKHRRLARTQLAVPSHDETGEKQVSPWLRDCRRQIEILGTGLVGEESELLGIEIVHGDEAR